ncbi:MAG: ketoacyl-ACP synthase III [Thermoguttaceae bacterium]|jgi:3-oxoacyl-[acyl-carrier-protein] synthase-3
MQARILGIAGHLPDRLETNADLARQHPDWDMSQIGEKTGILARRIAAAGETACDLGCRAGEKLLARGLAPLAEIDYVLFATQTPDHFLPANACLLHRRLGLAPHAGAVDVSSGCAGFVLALQLAQGLIGGGSARNVLVVTADTYSKLVHPDDRTVRSLFGDAAAATLVGAAEGPGIGQFVTGTDGSGASRLVVPAGGFRLPHSAATCLPSVDPQGGVRSQEHLFMDGQAVFAFTLNTVPRAIHTLLQKTGTGGEQIDWYVFHQANKYMLENLAKCSRIPAEKMIYHLAEVGNTVASSIPLAIEAACQSGRIRAAQRLILVGFGVGYSWAACDVTWTAPP